MRFNLFPGALVFAVAFVAGAGAIIWWCIIFARAARSLRIVGDTGRAELLALIVRRALLWGAGTVLFTTAFWLAVCHDLRGNAPTELLPYGIPSGPILPEARPERSD